MSISTKAARDRFTLVVRPAWHLIEIHKRNRGVGLRVEDLSLNRGAVVFAVAAWQTYVQEVTRAILGGMAPPAGDPTTGVYRLLASHVRDQVERLNNPDVRHTLPLFAAVNFDPSTAWTFTFDWEMQWSARYGSMRDGTSLNQHQVRQELDSWLQVRHKIAHGDQLPAEPRYKELVTGRSRGGEPRLTRRDADRCVNFFERLVLATDVEADTKFP